MLLSLTIIAPIFTLILIGYLAGRTKVLSDATGKGIADFTFTLAIPALLFRTIVKADFADQNIAGVWGAFFVAVGITWLAATLIVTQVLNRPADDTAPIAMSSSFGNTVMLGLPIAVATFGDEAAPTIALVLAIHAPILWSIGTVHQALLKTGKARSASATMSALGEELIHNPIVLGIAAGLVWRATGLPLSGPIDEVFRLLAQAGIPTALVALGLSLTTFQIGGKLPTLISVCALKLVLMPATAWLMATVVFGLDPVAAGVVTILAAMPTGANAYLFAVRQKTAVGSASGAVALGTLLTIPTSALLIALIHP